MQRPVKWNLIITIMNNYMSLLHTPDQEKKLVDFFEGYKKIDWIVEYITIEEWIEDITRSARYKGIHMVGLVEQVRKMVVDHLKK